MEVRFLCRRNVGLAGFCIGTSGDDGHADDLPTLGKQRWKDIVFGKALTTGLWSLDAVQRGFCVFHVVH